MLNFEEELYLGSAKSDENFVGFHITDDIFFGSISGPSYIDVLLSGVSPLALTNALELNYIKALGATEQRNLPSGYTQVEYIESDGTQYIDTGITDITDSEFNLVAQLTSISSGSYGCMLGSRLTNTSSNSFKVIFGYTDLGKIYTQAGTNESVGYIISNISDTNKHTLNLLVTANSQIFKIDNTTLTENYYPTTSTDYSLYLFARNNSGTAGNFVSQKVYSCWIKKNGVLVRNLIPCRRNSDNVLGMYDTVTGNFLTNQGTGTFTAGADVVPTPDTPMDIVCNNGVVKVSKNLYNSATRVNNYFISANGTITANTGSCYSALIPVKPNTQYVFSGRQTQGVSGKRVHAYDSSGNWIQQLNSSDGSTTNYTVSFTTTSSTAYARISLLMADADVQVEQGSTATPYMPYGKIYTDGTQETVEIHTKNLISTASQYVLLGQYTDASGNVVNSNVNFQTIKFPCKPNTTYTASISDSVTMLRVCVYNSSGTFVQRYNTQVGDGVKTITFTTGASVTQFNIGAQISASDTTQTMINAINWQIEQGSTATEYEPYFNGGTATAENLFKVGDYKDVQEVLTGSVTRNVGIKVLDGTETIIQSAYGNVFLYDGITDRVITKDTALCTHFTYSTSGTGSISNNAFGVSGTSVRVFFRNDSFTTAEQFKQWLADQYNAGQPVIVVYPLATPTTETVTGQSLTASGNCTVTATGALDNLELELSYKQGV